MRRVFSLVSGFMVGSFLLHRQMVSGDGSLDGWVSDQRLNFLNRFFSWDRWKARETYCVTEDQAEKSPDSKPSANTSWETTVPKYSLTPTSNVVPGSRSGFAGWSVPRSSGLEIEGDRGGA